MLDLIYHCEALHLRYHPQRKRQAAILGHNQILDRLKRYVPLLIGIPIPRLNMALTEQDLEAVSDLTPDEVTILLIYLAAKLFTTFLERPGNSQHVLLDIRRRILEESDEQADRP
jgi:hypothetical protein